VLSVRREIDDADARQPVLALEHDGVIREEVQARDHDGRTARKKLLPPVRARARDGGRDDAEVAAALVRPDVEEVAAVVHGVLVLFFARGDQ
jgi:hypothetical protein